MAEQPRPMIGLNVDLVPQTKTTRAHLRLNLGYMDAILRVGGMPMLMPPYGRDRDIELFLDRMDGFVLTGGLDLDPRRYNQTMHPTVVLTPERREDSDRILVRHLFDRQMPLLGIGMGMQLMNVYAGGSMFVHLPEEMPKSMPHFDSTCNGPHRHLVNVLPNTRLEEIYGGVELLVPSCHHQAAKTVGEGFRVCATAPDGVIEAIEWTDPAWFAFGLQWHPEAECASALDLQLLECFVQSAARNSNTTLALAG